MTAAVLKARQTVDEFLRIKVNRPDGATGFAVKVLFEDGTTKEHMWVNPFRASSSGYEGVLRNDPMQLRNLRKGSQVSFSKDQITDWGYNLSGRSKGYFTACVLIATNPQLRKSYEEQSGFQYECAL
ncbi:MAG: DUF2314 domain-containing protein [Pseudomonadota bacterium]